MTRPPLSLRKWNLRRWLYLQYILFVSSFVWTACKNTDDLHLQPRQRLSSLVQNITAPYYINLYQHPFIAPPHPHRHHRHYHHHHHHHHHQMCPSKTCLLLSGEDRLWWRRPHLLWKQMTRKSETLWAWPRPSTRTKRPRMAIFVCLFWWRWMIKCWLTGQGEFDWMYQVTPIHYPSAKGYINTSEPLKLYWVWEVWGVLLVQSQKVQTLNFRAQKL